MIGDKVTVGRKDEKIELQEGVDHVQISLLNLDHCGEFYTVGQSRKLIRLLQKMTDAVEIRCQEDKGIG